MTNGKGRIMIAALSLSAAGFVGILTSEGYEPVAKPPVAGDVPTNGFGSTGPDIKLGDKTDPVRAVQRALKDANTFERAVQRCAPVPMYQHEFDAWVNFAYNVGPTAFCTSTAAKLLKQERYSEACDEMLRWNKFKGQVLRGLVSRRERERRQCLGLAQGEQ